jgi:hypothetical protein
MEQTKKEKKELEQKMKDFERHYLWGFHKKIAQHAGRLYRTGASLYDYPIPELLVMGDLARREKEFENAYAYYSKAFIRTDMPMGEDFAYVKYKGGAVRRLERFVTQATKFLEEHNISPDRKRWIDMYIMAAELIARRYRK